VTWNSRNWRVAADSCELRRMRLRMRLRLERERLIHIASPQGCEAARRNPRVRAGDLGCAAGRYLSRRNFARVKGLARGELPRLWVRSTLVER
jgi:hypothetical protein